MARIIVGVDGSGSAEHALHWAVDHAAPDDEMVLVHAWNLQAVGAFEAPYLDVGLVESDAQQLVADLAGRAADQTGDEGPKISTAVRHGHPGQVLIDLSDGADLLVVGSRGYGGFKGLLLGSVSTYVVHHALCPVTVVPPPPPEA